MRESSAAATAESPGQRRGSVELLVTAGRVVTMDAARTVITDGAVAVRAGRIEAVGPASELRHRFPDCPVLAEPRGIATPGYVDAHQHLTGDRLIRSTIPDTITSEQSIFEWAVPIHAAQDADDERLAATLACAEALSNGVTTVIEAGTVAHPLAVAEAIDASGVRSSIGTWGWDVGDGPGAGSTSAVLARLETLLERFPPDPRARIRGSVTLVGHDLMSDELLGQASALARGAGALLTFHISPSRGDARAYLERTGMRPLVHFAEIGALGPHVLLGHAVHLDDDEIETLLDTGAAVAYCPWAYVRLAQGVVRGGRHDEIVRRGGRVALGCDSENAGDQIDVLRAAALAAGLARDRAEDPRAFGAHEALALATCDGARAIGLGDLVGSLEVGKRADIVVHRSSSVPAGGDVELELVWGTDGRSVTHVLVDGVLVVRDGRVLTVDVDALAHSASARSAALLRSIGR